jgi:hypothetical protein
MKNNFDLNKFLTENTLTSNSKLLKEQQLPDATKDLKASEAFKAVGIDMSKPVLVLTQDGGHGEQETKGTVSAEEALKMFQRLRAEGMKNDKQDHYEFDNEINFHAEGYEYKIAYFEEESTTTALMQKATVSEKKGNHHDEEILAYIADTYIQNAKDGDSNYAGFLDLNIRDAVQDVVGILKDRKHPLYRETRKEYQIVSRDKARGLFEKKDKDVDEDAGTLQVSMGSNAEEEQKVIDIARAAIGLMDEQPGTSAEDALATVLDI